MPTSGSSDTGNLAWTNPFPAVSHWWIRRRFTNIYQRHNHTYTYMLRVFTDVTISICITLVEDTTLNIKTNIEGIASFYNDSEIKGNNWNEKQINR